MKTLIKVISLLIVWSSGVCITPQEASAQQVSVSFQLFYDELSPYGMWVEYPNYGYVWIPNGVPGFSPYSTAGHWIFTDDGWTWVSDYPWGWAPFHYGRWDYDNVYGWLWVPDNEWGPAWVSWRRSPGYYGWAPLRPGISISMAFGREYREQNERWIFVRDRDISRPDIGRHYVNRNNNATIINNSTVIPNTRNDSRRNATYITGPDRDDVQRVTHATVTPIVIRESDKPGHRLSKGELQIYRPLVQKRSGNGQNPAPSKVIRLNDVRPASERNAGNRQPDVSPTNNGRKNQPSEIRTPQNKGRKQQPRVVTPPKTDQPPQPRSVTPSDSRGKQQQPRKVTPPKTDQPSQPRSVNPSNSRGKQQQPQRVTPPSTGQPSQPRSVNPSNSRGKQQQPQKVTPPSTGQPPQPRNVHPSNNRGKQQQPQKVTPPKKDGESQPSQPKTNQQKQDEKKQQDKKERGQ